MECSSKALQSLVILFAPYIPKGNVVIQQSFNIWINSSCLFVKEPLPYLVAQDFRTFSSKEPAAREKRFLGPNPLLFSC